MVGLAGGHGGAPLVWDGAVTNGIREEGSQSYDDSLNSKQPQCYQGLIGEYY
jgi:hypothetical protein